MGGGVWGDKYDSGVVIIEITKHHDRPNQLQERSWGSWINSVRIPR
jgi:hypothetical protein